VTPLIETRGVSKAYGDFVALHDVSLAIAPDELVSIVGPNGAGKTTLVNVLTGLLKPTSGTVHFKGEDIAGIGPVKLARRGMARAFQLVHIFPAMTVAQMIAVAVSRSRQEPAHVRAAIGQGAAVRDACARCRDLRLEGKLDAESRLSPRARRSSRHRERLRALPR
jgi:branched-chain amino acid transport system ATP-binding protein